MEKYQFSQMKKKDERVRIIAEILSGIKVIKLFGWELSFIKKINEIRKEEIDQLRIFQYLEATQFFAWTSAPLLGFYIMYKLFFTFSSFDYLNTAPPSRKGGNNTRCISRKRAALYINLIQAPH